MPIVVNVTATGTLVDVLSEIRPIAISAGRTADSSLAKATNIETDIETNIKPQTNKIPSIDLKADKALDDAVQAIVDADRAIDAANDAKMVSDLALDDANKAIAQADDALGRAGTALNNTLDLFDRVANIFNIIATLGTIVRMEQIRADLQEQIDGILGEMSGILAAIQALGDALSGRLSDIENYVNDIPSIRTDLGGRIDRANEGISDIKNYFPVISGKISNLQAGVNGANEGIYDLKNYSSDILGGILNLNAGIDTANEGIADIRNYSSDILGKISNLQAEIGAASEGIADLINDVQGLPPTLRSAVCEALNSGCFDFPSHGGGDSSRFDALEDLIGELLDRLPDGEQHLSEKLDLIKQWIANAVVDNRLSNVGVARVVSLLARNQTKFLNECKKQQLIDFNSQDLLYFGTAGIDNAGLWTVEGIPLPSDDAWKILDRDQTAVNTELTELTTLLGLQETANIAALAEQKTALDELRLDSEAPDSVNGFPYEVTE